MDQGSWRPRSIRVIKGNKNEWNLRDFIFEQRYYKNDVWYINMGRLSSDLVAKSSIEGFYVLCCSLLARSISGLYLDFWLLETKWRLDHLRSSQLEQINWLWNQMNASVNWIKYFYLSNSWLNLISIHLKVD